MKNLLYFLVLILLYSCDDGDIIITSFEFNDAALQLCEGAKENEFVFFKINTTNNEAISYNFIDDRYSEQEQTIEAIVIDLSDTNNPNSLIYRQFNNSVTATYYCNNIPNSGILVTEELKSISGTATIINSIINEDDNDGIDNTSESTNNINPLGDPDFDGVPNYLDDDMNDANIGDINGEIEKGYNTDKDDDKDIDGIEYDDGDNIPDFKDQDDDNDNILTSAELTNIDVNDGSFLDTDGDGKPNYLDSDDDGDGILTRNEDINQNGDLTDDDTDGDGTPNYLDDDDAISIINQPNLPNSVTTTFRTFVSFTDLKFNKETTQFEKDENGQISFSLEFRDVTVPINNNNN